MVQIFGPSCVELHGSKEVVASHSTENPVASNESASGLLGADVSSLRDSASHNTMQLPSLHVSDIVRFMHYIRCWKRVYSLKPSDESFSRNAGNDDEYSCSHWNYCFPPKPRCAGLVMCASRRKGCAVSPCTAIVTSGCR